MTEPCADRCTVLADVVARLAQARGTSEAHERLSMGLSPEYVPPVPRTSSSSALRWLTDEFTD